MVSWTTFVRLAYEVIEAKGGRVEGIAEGADIMQDVIAPIWRENKETLKGYTESQARSLLREEITVS